MNLAKVLKNNIYIIVTFMALCLVSCDNSSEDFNISKTIDFNVFSLDTPQEWTMFEQQGIDTYIGGLTNTIDTLYFDYGYLSYGSLDYITPNSESISFEKLKINGYDAKIVKEKRSDEYKVRYSLYIDKGDEQNLNRIYGYGLKNEKLARAIFTSHKFK